MVMQSMSQLREVLPCVFDLPFEIVLLHVESGVQLGEGGALGIDWIAVWNICQGC